jgi:O-antigen/teichoic acid export membrane protein
MTFKKRLFQNFLWRGIYYATVFLLNVMVARAYEAEMSGWINFISNNFAFALLIGSLSLESAFIYYGASKEIAEHKLATFAFLWSIGAGVIFYVFINFFVGTNTAIASKNLVKFAAFTYFLGIIMTNFFMNLFLIKSQYLLPNLLLSIANIILIVCIPNNIFNINFFERIPYLYFYYGMFLIQGVLLLIFYFLTHHTIKLRLPNAAEVQKILRYASLALVANLVFFLVYRIDYWFIDYFYKDGVALGNYIQASKLGQMLLVLATIIGGIVFPQTAAGSILFVKQKLFKIFRLLLVFFIMVIATTALLGNSFLVTIFGPSFNEMFEPLLLLLPGIFFLSILTILSSYFGGIKKVWVNIVSAALGLFIIVIGDGLFIPHYGIVAAAIVSTVGYLSCLLFSLYQFNKVHPFTIRELLTIKKTDFFWLKQSIQKAT